MREIPVTIFFDHRGSTIQGDLHIPESGLVSLIRFSFDESATYEEMVRTLVQEGRLLPLDDPRLRYNFVLQAFEAYSRDKGYFLHPPRSLSKPVILREGQTLASTHLTHLVMDELEVMHRQWSDPYRALFCATSIEIENSPPLKSPSSTTSSGWSEVMSTVGNLFVTTLTATATAASVIGGLDVVERRWRENHATQNTRSQRNTVQISASEIVAIRLLMTDGTQHRFEEWLIEPVRLKHYIDVFSQPSSSIKPLQAVFVLRKGELIVVDVSQGAQNNLQLNEVLSYLSIDDIEK